MCGGGGEGHVSSDILPSCIGSFTVSAPEEAARFREFVSTHRREGLNAAGRSSEKPEPGAETHMQREVHRLGRGQGRGWDQSRY